MGWIDVHAHLDMLEEGAEAAIQKALSAGVSNIITIGTEGPDHPVVLALAEKYAPHVYCTLGVHPHQGSQWTPEVKKFMLENLNNPRVLAVGEIGLDYYYNQSPKEDQLQTFEEQMEIAQEFNLPVEIHTRDAEEDTATMLKKFSGKVNGLLHCFTSSYELAKVALNCGFNISVSGVVTFKNASDLREAIKKIPLDRLHVETDAPFLAPVPQRGKKNTPAFVVHTAQVVADLKGVSLEELQEITNTNALKMFSKLKLHKEST